MTSTRSAIRLAGFGVTTIVTIALALALGTHAAAQLASRPAEDWAKVLDAPERLNALRVDDVVARLKLKPGDAVADLGAGTEQASALFASIGFKPIEDVTLFPDKWFVVFGR